MQKKVFFLINNLLFNTKKNRAGVLWYLLPVNERKLVAKELTTEELKLLKKSQTTYRNENVESRTKLELDLGLFLTKKKPLLPLIISLIGFSFVVVLLIIHILVLPNMIMPIRLGIFNSLLLGILAPLSLYLLPSWKRKTIFSFTFKVETVVSAFLIYIVLMWLLTEINQLMPSGGLTLKLDTFSLLLLLVGAVTAPIFEEVIFRELIPTLFGKEPYFIGQIIGATLFAISHFPSSTEMFCYYLVAGALLGVLRIQSGGLAFGLLAHCMANAVIAVI